MPTWMLNLWAGYQTHVVSPLYFNADVGQNTANTIKTIANDLKIAALVGMGASIMWGLACLVLVARKPHGKQRNAGFKPVLVLLSALPLGSC